MKHRNQIGIPLFTNTKREKKNSKFVFAKHVIKGNIDDIIRVFSREIGNNVFNEGFEKRVSDRGKGIEETSKATFNRGKKN